MARFLISLWWALLGLIVLSACGPQLPGVVRPFPQTPIDDPTLVADFQDLATDADLLTYQLIDVRKGALGAGLAYQIPLIAPAQIDLVFVAACGRKCQGVQLSLQDAMGVNRGVSIQKQGRTYLTYGTPGAREPLLLTLNLRDCQADVCAAYMALYAK